MSDNFRSKIVLSPGAPQVSSDRLAMEPGLPQWWKRCWGNSCTSRHSRGRPCAQTALWPGKQTTVWAPGQPFQAAAF